MSEFLPPSEEQINVNVMDRMRHAAIDLRHDLGRAAAGLLVVSGTLAAFTAREVIDSTPAHADTAQAVIGMPFEGKWAYDTKVEPPYTDANSSHPSAHEAYGFNWATDLYAAQDTDVEVYGSSPQGTVTFKRSGTSDTCSSYGANIAGQGVTFDVLVNDSKIGEVKYDHIDPVDVGSNAIASGTKIGEVTSEPLNASCFQARHTHIQFKNTAGNYSCYVDHGKPGEGTIGAAADLGVIGSANTNAKEACIDTPSVPPADTDHDAIPDTQDQCPTVPGIPGLQGCPPKDIDRDGIADLVVVNTQNTGSGVTEAHELTGGSGYNTWFGHQATAVGYLNSTQETLMGDVNADYRPDLVVVNTNNTGSGKVEVHALDAATHYSTWIGHWVTPADYLSANQRLAIGDVNADKIADVVVVNAANTDSGHVEVHPLSGATHYSAWLGHYVANPLTSLDSTQRVVMGG